MTTKIARLLTLPLTALVLFALPAAEASAHMLWG